MSAQQSRSNYLGRQFFSISNQMTYGTILLVLLSLLITGGGLIALSFQTQRTQIESTLRERGRSAAGEVDSYAADLQRKLDFLARVPGLVELRAEDQQNLLKGLSRHNDAYELLVIADAQGKVLTELSPFNTRPTTLVDPLAFQTTVEHQEVYQGPVVVDPATGLPLITLAVPVRNEADQVAGMLQATINLSFLWHIVSRIDIGETGQAYVIDVRGRLIAKKGDDPRQVVLQELSNVAVLESIRNDTLDHAEYQGLNGETVLGSAVPIRNLNWTVIVELPTLEAYSSLREMQVLMGIALVVALVLAGGLGIFFARQVVVPLRQLTGAAAKIGAGQLDTQVAINRNNEMGVLATTFNSMSQRLKETLEGLEQRFSAEQDAKTESERLRLELEQAMAGLEDRMLAEQEAKAESERAKNESEHLRLRLEHAVSKYLAFAQHVSTGDLSRRLEVTDEGALGELGHGLNGMVAALQLMTRQVYEASAQLSSVATELLASTTQQSGSAAEQLASITQTTTTIEEIKAIALQTAERATHVNEDSQTALGVARQGIQAIDETIHGMNHIRMRVEGIAHTILTLSDQTQTIGVIIQTVNELADQSNLLALNAAIEAARAGEQGKSFAVVAQHVRDLAERSKEATAQVREILGEIQHATNAAVMVTEEGTKGVDVGSVLVTQSGEVIHRIAAEVEKGAQANIQMAVAAQQQMSGMEQIGDAMVAIQDAMMQTLSSTRQTELAAQNLNGLANSLQKVVATYRI